MTALTGVLLGKALGQGIALLYVYTKDWFDARWVRREPVALGSLPAMSTIFFDKEFIRSLHSEVSCFRDLNLPGTAQ
jgi:hypothetical protein